MAQQTCFRIQNYYVKVKTISPKQSNIYWSKLSFHQGQKAKRVTQEWNHYLDLCEYAAAND